jgi:hypothetical protein
MAGRGTALRAGKAQSSSADVGLHEAGHAISWPLGLRGADFKTAYEQDANKGPLADGYYHQKDQQAGRDEAYAESHAEYLRDPAAMKAQYPHLYAYWQHFYGAAK